MTISIAKLANLIPAYNDIGSNNIADVAISPVPPLPVPAERLPIILQRDNSTT